MQISKIPIVPLLVTWLLWYPSESVSAPKASQTERKDGVELRIVKVERQDLTPADLRWVPYADPIIAAKWQVTTELTNTTKELKLVSISPYYCATVEGLIEQSVLLPGSRAPIKSKEHDFVELPPGGKLLAKHVVLAIRNQEDTGYFLCGHHKAQPDQFNVDWSLKPFPAENNFNLSIILLGLVPPDSKEVLGKDFEKLWTGRTMSKPVKLRVVESDKSK
jgi:hypothetical protein